MAIVLVTGGAGFLGALLCERLLDRGDRVVCLDSLQTGSQDNVGRLFGNRRFSFLERDICTPLNLRVDEIYNFACPASPRHYQADPVRTMRTCVIGMLNILDLARINDAKVMQASTSEVYGDPDVHPQQEGYCGNVRTTGIRACYDEGKRAAETLIYDYRRQYGLNVRVARIFNTYGPGMDRDDGRVVSNFIVQALQQEDITIYGDGRQTRSFCYRDDLVEGVIRLMDAPDTMMSPTNLGNPAELAILDLAELVLAITGSRSRIVFRPRPEDDPVQRCPDIRRARTELGWQPCVGLRDGLRETIRYFEARLASTVDRGRMDAAE